MNEQDYIKYTGVSSFNEKKKKKAQECVKRTYKSAVELFAYLCKVYKLNPLKDGVIISHKEGCARGIASNHGDPEHLWKGVGLSYTMDKFRKDVKKAMDGTATTTSTTSKEFKVTVTRTNLNIRKGAGLSYDKTGYIPKGTYTIISTKKKDGFTWGKLKSGLGWIALEYTTKL